MGTKDDLETELARIEAFYANELNSIIVEVETIAHLLPAKSLRQASDRLVEESQGSLNKAWLNSQPADLTDLAGRALFKGLRKGGARASLTKTTFQRTLVSMSEPERAALRLGEVLRALRFLDRDDHLRAITSIVWNKGDTLIDVGGGHGGNFRGQEAARNILRELITSTFGDSNSGRERIQAALRDALDERNGLPERDRTILERYLFAGARWLTGTEALSALTPHGATPSALRLGLIAGTKTELMFDLRESLITIAPPGAGKSQAHVLRNLLYLNAPAVVLDIKGEMREGSSAWRAANVGPALVFDPKAPEHSLSYNPLDFIGTDPETAWDEARRLADLLVVPPNHSRSDEYFEGRARDMITTAVFDVALNEEAEMRSMRGVLDCLYLSGDELVSWFDHLRESQSPQLRRQAAALKDMPAKQRESIFDTARRHLEVWQSPAIERLSATSTISAASLRADKATLYLCIGLDDVRKFASVLRVIIGQTVHALCRVKPESDAPPVTFFLDELPRLGRMDVIEEALDVGRSYGVRLWMFCQNAGQLATAYPNADGMIGNCAARCYMNPDEDTARWMSTNLGMRDGLLDGQRKPLAEAPQLSGKEFADHMVVFLRKNAPARLEKQPAFNDPTCVARMESPVSPAVPAAPKQQPAAPVIKVPLESPSQPAAHSAEQVAPTPVVAAPAVPPEPHSTRSFDWRRWLLPAAVTAGALAWSAFITDRSNTLQEDAVNAMAAAQTMETATKKEREALRAELVTARRTAQTLTSRAENAEQRALASQSNFDTARAEKKSAEQELQQTRERLAALETRSAEQIPVATPPQPTAPRIGTGTYQPYRPSWFPQPTASPQAVAADVDECDRLANNQSDPRRTGRHPPVKFGELKPNAATAVQICARALQAAPDDLRVKFHLARAVHASGLEPDRAFDLMKELAAAAYPAAFDNLGNLLTQRGDLVNAAIQYRNGAVAGDTDAMLSLADAIEKKRAPGSPIDAQRWLIEAAKRGDTRARAELDQRKAQGTLLPIFLEAANEIFRRATQ
jgi:type IV secretory pathway TraG/TraD family ATPase VirD4